MGWDDSYPSLGDHVLGTLAGRHATVALFDDVVQYSNAGLGEGFVCLKTSIPISFGDNLFKLCFLYP